MGPDGTIYSQKQDLATGSENGLVALNPNGTMKWFTNATVGPGNVGNNIAIGQDGTIYCMANVAKQPPADPITGAQQFLYDFRIRALNPENASIEWEYAAPGGGLDESDQLIASPNGELIFPLINQNTSAIMALHPNGTLAWSCSVPFLKSLIAVSTNSTINAMSSDGILYSIDSNGTIRWHVTLPPAFGDVQSISIDDTGSIYIVTNDYGYAAHLFKYYPNGRLYWNYELKKCEIQLPPVIDRLGNVYVAFSNISNLYSSSGERLMPGIMSLDPNGKPNWIILHENGPMAMSADGIIYVASEHFFFSLKTDGTTIWQQDVMHAPSPLDDSMSFNGGKEVAIGPNGTVYFTGQLDVWASFQGYVFAVKGTPSYVDPGLNQQWLIAIISILIMAGLLVILCVVKKKSGGWEP